MSAPKLCAIISRLMSPSKNASKHVEKYLNERYSCLCSKFEQQKIQFTAFSSQIIDIEVAPNGTTHYYLT